MAAQGQWDQSNRRIPTRLVDDDLQKLLAQPNTGCITGLRDRAMLEVMAFAGLRVSEVVALQRTQITWPGPGQQGQLLIRHAKGDTNRVVHIGDGTANWLRQWDRERYSYCRAAFFHTIRGSSGITSAQKHQPLATRTVQQMVKNYAAQAGLPTEGEERVTPHVLRHTYATNLVRRNTPLEAVRRLLGHQSISTTEIYLHLADEECGEYVRRAFDGDQDQRSLDGLPSTQAVAAGRRMERAAERLGVSVDQLVEALLPGD